MSNGTDTLSPQHTGPSKRADRIGRGLVAFDVVATIVAFVGGLVLMAHAADDRLVVEGWRTFGYLLCAGLWVLITLWPRRTPGIWELLLVQKTLVTTWALINLGAHESQGTAVVDSLLVVTTATAYVLCRGWYAWHGTTRRGALCTATTS